MYSAYGQFIHREKSKIYISKRGNIIQDENLNEIVEYSKPEKFFWNIQPVNQESEIKEFGQLVSSMKVAIIPKSKYINKFKEFDLAYIDGCSPDEEISYGDNANYRIHTIKNQNTIIKLYFLKLVKEEGDIYGK